ncbi:MAG: nuclear transport factor 2 family protein [Chloroflexota bacterium]
MSATPGRAFLDTRIELLVAGRSDDMVDAGYNENAVFISFDGQVKGKEALKAHFRQHLPAMGSIQLKSVDKFAEGEDSVFFEVTVITGNYGEVTSFEAFVLRGGKADYHFTALR